MRSFPRALLVHLALASSLVLAGCGGSSGDGPVAPPVVPVTPDPVTRVVVSPDTGSGYVGDVLALSAHAYTAKGAEVTGKSVSWGTPDAAVATVDAAGSVHFLASGVAHITAMVDAVPGSAVLNARPSPPARLVLTPAAVLVGTGQAVSTTVAVTDRQGAVIASPTVTYTSTNTGVATVSSAGTISSLTAGTARVIASITAPTGSFADTTVVTVGGGAALSITLPDTVIAPAQTLTLGGAGLSSATASIGGIAVPLSNVTSTSASLTVPASLFQPCLRAGVTYPVVVRVGSDSVIGQLAAQAVPIQVSLAPGGHVIVQSGLDRGCAIATSAGGTYMVMPYTWDQDYQWGQPPQSYTSAQPTVNGTISVIDAPLTSGAAASASRSPFGIAPSVLARAVASRAVLSPALSMARTSSSLAPSSAVLESPVPLWSRQTRARRLASLGASGSAHTLTPTAACIPMTVGASVRRYTARNASGWANQSSQPTDPIEPWYVAQVGTSVAVVVDSMMWRVLQSDATVNQRLQVVVAAYDSSIAPLLTANLGPAPDIDGNGRLLVFLPYWGGFVSTDGHGASSYGGPMGYNSPDCDPNAQGEGTVMPSAVGMAADAGNKTAPTPSAGTFLSVLAHESTHAWDVSPTHQVLGTNWGVEALAELMRLLWINRTFSAPLGMNAPSAAFGTFGGQQVVSNLCLAPDLSTSGNGLTRVENLYFVYQEPREYNLGCNLLRFAVQRAMASGTSTAGAIGRFMAATNSRRTYAAMFNAINASSRADRDIWGEFFLSWAGDGVAGASPDIQDALYQVKPAFLQFSSAYSWAIPESSIQPGQAKSFALHEPSVHYYQVSSTHPVWVTYAGDGGAPVPITRTGLAILRLQ